MRAIVISGLPCVGKTTVAKIIAETFELPMTGGGDILKEMAIDRGYSAKGNDWWDGSEGMRFLKERETNPDFDKEADRRLAEKIKKGNVVITSYTAPWITKEGFKVWLTGGTDKRAQRMADRDNASAAECERIIKIRDDENRKLYMRLYGIDFGHDMEPFDLVVDTNEIEAAKVADIIIKKIKELKL